MYGGPEGWAFVEEASYKLLIDSILEDQENEKCALREPNLLEDQEREKPGESAFEVTIYSFFVTVSLRHSIWYWIGLFSFLSLIKYHVYFLIHHGEFTHYLSGI